MKPGAEGVHSERPMVVCSDGWIRYPDGSDIRCRLYRGPGRSAAVTMYVYVYVDELEIPLGISKIRLRAWPSLTPHQCSEILMIILIHMKFLLCFRFSSGSPKQVLPTEHSPMISLCGDPVD